MVAFLDGPMYKTTVLFGDEVGWEDKTAVSSEDEVVWMGKAVVWVEVKAVGE